MTNELFPLINESCRGGHAGAGSTWSYVHRIELPMARLTTEATGARRTFRLDHALAEAVFPDVAAQLLHGVEPEMPVSLDEVVGIDRSWQLSLAHRADIAARLAAAETVEQAAAHCNLPEDVVVTVADEVVQSLVDARLISNACLRSRRNVLLALRSHHTWARACRQLKYAPLKQKLAEALAHGRKQELKEITLAWLSCVHGKNIDVAAAGLDVIGYLRAAGVSRSQMAITTAIPHRDWPRNLQRLGLAHRVGRERAGQATYRLALTERSVNAAAARAASVSVVGVSWWFTLARSAVLALPSMNETNHVGRK